MSATRLLLVRHGETQWNVEGRIQGHVDTPLNPLGQTQARALGKRLLGERFDAVYSSDLLRAYATARCAVGDTGRGIIREPRLRERHLGVLQGLTATEAVTRAPAAWQAYKGHDPAQALEGGESLPEFARRVTEFAEHLVRTHAGERLLLVTHGGVLDILYRHAAGMALALPRDFPVYNASLNLISCDAGAWRVESWADVSHLPSEAALDDT